MKKKKEFTEEERQEFARLTKELQIGLIVMEIRKAATYAHSINIGEEAFFKAALLAWREVDLQDVFHRRGFHRRSKALHQVQELRVAKFFELAPERRLWRWCAQRNRRGRRHVPDQPHHESRHVNPDCMFRIGDLVRPKTRVLAIDPVACFKVLGLQADGFMCLKHERWQNAVNGHLLG